MMDPSMLIWGMIFGILGLGFFTYGKKQRALVPLSTGIGLFTIPYFISDQSTLIGVGLLLLCIPFVIRSPELWNIFQIENPIIKLEFSRWARAIVETKETEDLAWPCPFCTLWEKRCLSTRFKLYLIYPQG